LSNELAIGQRRASDQLRHATAGLGANHLVQQLDSHPLVVVGGRLAFVVCPLD
jgi:hypothetical protein